MPGTFEKVLRYYENAKVNSLQYIIDSKLRSILSYGKDFLYGMQETEQWIAIMMRTLC